MAYRNCVAIYFSHVRPSWWAALVLVIGIMLVFGPATTFDFVVWDDDLHVYANPYLTPFSWPNISTFWRASYEHLYIPLTYTVWAAVAWISQAGYLFPMTAEPFHRLNILLHIASVFVVYRLGLQLLNCRATPTPQTVRAAVLGALVFGLHPLQVEAVAWVSGLKDVLCGWWSVLALWQYLACVQSKQTRKKALHYSVATVAFGCALLSKPTAVSVPVMAGLLAIVGLKQAWQPALCALSPWLLIALVCSVWTKSQQPDIALTFVTPLAIRPVIALDTITFYLWKLLWPVGLGPDYGRTPHMVFEQGWGLLTSMVPLWLGLMLWRWGRHCNGVRLASGVCLAGMAPALGLVPFMFQAYSTVADRYMYLAMIGVALGVGWLSQRRGPWHAVTITGILLVSLLVWRSAQQVQIWRDTESLLTHALQVNPQSAMSYNNLGLTLAQGERLDEALAAFQTAVQLRPDLPEAHYNLGKVFTLQGRLDEAIVHHQMALQHRPGWAEAHNNVGVTLATQGQHAAALAAYARALLLKPGWADVYYNIGNVFVQQGNYAEASAAYRAALRSRTVWLPAATSLVRLLSTHFSSSPQAVREAVELAEQACRATGNHDATAFHTLAIAYHTAGQSSQAIQAAEQALSLAKATANTSLVQEVEAFLMTARQRLSHHAVP